MAKFKSMGQGVWKPVNEAAEYVQLKQDVQDGKASYEQLRQFEAKLKAKIEKAEIKERERVAEEVKKRQEVHVIASR